MRRRENPAKRGDPDAGRRAPPCGSPPQLEFHRYAASDVVHEAADAGDARAKAAVPRLEAPPGGDLWLDRLGNTGLTYGFRFCSADGSMTYATGTRVLVRLDAETLRPAPWSDGFRAAGRALLRPES